MVTTCACLPHMYMCHIQFSYLFVIQYVIFCFTGLYEIRRWPKAPAWGRAWGRPWGLAKLDRLGGDIQWERKGRTDNKAPTY